MAERKIGSSWQKLTGTGPYTDPTDRSSWAKLTGRGYYAKGQPGYRPASETNNLLGRKAKKRPADDGITEVAAAKKKPAYVASVPEETPPVKQTAAAPTPKPAPKAEPKRAAPKKSRPSEMDEFLASLGPDSRVAKMLRGNSGERVAKMKKGGMVGSASKRADGCASKGKTKGRYI